MIADCEAGKIDYVLTKSISRFARNTLDCIAEVRHLQALGVNIYFEENNLDTGVAYSEMLLTVLAAFAQEESRSLSENIKWSIRKGFQSGKDRWSRIYGYAKAESGKYTVVESEAAVVRRIFDAYEKGRSMSKIGKKLEADGVPTPSGGQTWNSALVGSILENEKYAGDIQLQKFYTKDHLSHAIIKNSGELEMKYLENHHEGIVSQTSFRRVREIRALRNEKKGSPQYPFGAKLLCPHCGRPLYQRKLKIQRQKSGWNCERGADACNRFLIRSCYVEAALLRVCPEFESVEYWWVDEKIDMITFGLDAETEESDNTMIITWKDGATTVVDELVDRKSEHPEYVAWLYWAWLQRTQDGTLGQQVRTKGSKVVNGKVVPARR